MPSLYLSETELTAIRYCATQVANTLSGISDPVELEKVQAHLAHVRSIENKFRNINSARRLKKAMRARYKQKN